MKKTLKILVIDDSEDDRELYQRSLRKSTDTNYSIIETGDGEDGLDNIAKHNPDCILLDYSLPGRNGIEVLKRIRGKHPHIAVVIMTGQGNENVAVTAIKEGAQDYIAKSSVTPESLQRIILVAIEHCALQKRIHDQQTSLEVFSRALAHDLKEPVNTMGSFLDLLMAHETLSERGKGYLNYVRNAASRMSALIDTVYFYTRLDGEGAQEITKGACDVNQILNDTKDNLHALILERKAIITNDALPTVHANRVQLIQILQNLIANAIHYCEVDPVIHVHVDEEKEYWKFSVKDNGPGINAELQNKLFEPFKRLSRQRGKGLGLGLAICKKIAESHNGNIWYDFDPAKGTTFVFTIAKPAAAARLAEISPKLAMSRKSLVSDSDNRPLANILLVEDNEADIEMTRLMLLEEAGLRCNLFVAGDAFEALAVMKAQKEKSGSIDLLLLDINMPGIDGFELMERMHADQVLQLMPVVLCTTSNYSKDIEKAKLLGAKGYVNKPTEIGKLKAVIDGIETVRLCPEDNGYALLRSA